jgi:catalase
MDGWGVHTFRFVTDEGKTKLVKFRFKTLQGKASLLWEEAQITAGKNADFHRQDLFDAIDKELYPEYEFQAQIMEEEDQLRFGFDLLDPTKIVPEELVPFTALGKLTLNRNPRNYFAETEQVMVIIMTSSFSLIMLTPCLVSAGSHSPRHRLYR